MTPRVQATTNTKKDNLVYIKIKNICGSKDTIKKVKEQFTEMGENVYNHISKIYKEFLQLNNGQKDYIDIIPRKI